MMRIGLAGLVLLTAAPAVATTSISGTVNVDARSQLGALVDAHTDSANAVAPIVASLSAQASSNVSNAGATASSFSGISAFWTSADAGSVGLVWGWNIAADGSGLSVSVGTDSSYPVNWQYTFIASGNGTFSGRYNILGAGYTFGLQPLYTTNDWTSGTLGGDVQDPTGSGIFSVALVSGHIYTMSIANYGNFSSASTAVDSSADSNFQWQIAYSAAPEPASWALMLGGFGAIGTAMRSRRRLVASFR